MNRLLTKRQTLAVMTFAIVCLAAAVFLWGTEYKVSLYPHDLGRRPAVPIAKLLSERERPAVSAEVLPQTETRALTAFFSLALLAVGFAWKDNDLIRAEILRRSAVISIHGTPCLFRFSFRPPPSMAA